MAFTVGVAAMATLTFVGGSLLARVSQDANAAPLAVRHLDGEGPMGSTGDSSAWSTQAVGVTAPGTSWTVGIHLCLTRGDQPAVLEGSVTPTQTIGRGYRFLGAGVRRFVPALGDDPIGGVEGYPPRVSEPVEKVTGYSVAFGCDADHPDKSVPYDELLLGFARGDGQGGGGWMGVDIAYRVGDHQYLVTLGYNFLVCGALVPQRYCR